MRTITQKAVKSFYAREQKNYGNTKIVNELNSTYMYLHDNLIAVLDSENNLEISNAQWFSNTTKERLNGLEGVKIYQKNYKWYLNGEEWNGEFKKVN